MKQKLKEQTSVRKRDEIKEISVNYHYGFTGISLQVLHSNDKRQEKLKD